MLAVVSVLSLAFRVAWLSDPCANPCRGEAAHSLIFDEVYYVNAARRIDGLAVPKSQPYAGDPAGQDDNSEHPQLVKLVIAGAIEVFGDGPFAWRIGSVIFGSLAILGMFALALAAGASRWCAVLAATLMAADSLMIVHGRIATLDIYVVAFMVWAAAAYLGGRPIVGGVLLGLGATTKLVAPYLLFALLLVELLRHRRYGFRAAAVAFAELTMVATGVYLAVLAAFDRIAPPYDPQTGRTITGGPIAHTSHILSYAAGQTSPDGPKGIASYPWDWFADIKPINYLNVTVTTGSSRTATVHFLGLISPPILAFAVPALAFALLAAWRGGRADAVAVGWFLGTWLPFAASSVILERTSYLYYMVIVMPGIYLALALIFTRRWMPHWALGLWLLVVLASAVLTYPFLPFPAIGS
ncbi:MAG TPA: glycosyltransferase family 39 protein [Solirubrobacteraceae bacterium]|nr:glycosyltransferase family 39 protein [Solirubrobacteraceae bacterium]